MNMKAKIFLFLMAMLFVFTSCGKETYVQGVIVNKYVNPPRTIYQPVYTGKVMMMMPYTHPQEHNIVVYVDFIDQQFVKNIGYDLYNSLNIGDTVAIKVRVH